MKDKVGGKDGRKGGRREVERKKGCVTSIAVCTVAWNVIAKFEVPAPPLPWPSDLGQVT